MIEEIVPLTPAPFFAIATGVTPFKGKPGEALDKHHLLPDLSAFHAAPPFAKVYFAWSSKGLAAQIEAKTAPVRSTFPDISGGDAMELFIDTRNVKTSGVMTRYCHHFFFLPEPVETEERRVQAGEITRFRTEDMHELADQANLFVKAKIEKRGYLLQIFIPSESLFGYDPVQFKQIGFTYRISRSEGEPQHFAASSDDFPIEHHPALWGTLDLVEGT